MVYNVAMRSNNSGVALLDSIIAVSIFVVLFIGFFVLMQVGLRTVTEHRARTGALAVATSKIEYVRSLDYESVGLQGGDPAGVIEPVSYETLNSMQYTLSTSIEWQDDPADGLYGAGDSSPKDIRV